MEKDELVQEINRLKTLLETHSIDPDPKPKVKSHMDHIKEIETEASQNICEIIEATEAATGRPFEVYPPQAKPVMVLVHRGNEPDGLPDCTPGSRDISAWEHHFAELQQHERRARTGKSWDACETEKLREGFKMFVKRAAYKRNRGELAIICKLRQLFPQLAR